MDQSYIGPEWGEGMEYLTKENLGFQRTYVLHYLTGEGFLYNFEEEQMIRSLEGQYYDEDDLLNVFIDLPVQYFNMIPPTHYATLVMFAVHHGKSLKKVEFSIEGTNNRIPYYLFDGMGFMTIEAIQGSERRG